MNVPPLSGITPIFANDWMKFASEDAKTMSHANARLAPAPAAVAVHRAHDRLLERANREDYRIPCIAHEVAEIGEHAVLRHRLGKVLTGAERASGAGQQDGADRIVTRHVGQRACSSRAMAASKLFRTSGRFRVNVAMPSSVERMIESVAIEAPRRWFRRSIKHSDRSIPEPRGRLDIRPANAVLKQSVYSY